MVESRLHWLVTCYEFRDGKILNKDTYWKIVEHKDRF